MNKLLTCLTVLLALNGAAAIVPADTMKSVNGTVVETGNFIVIQTSSGPASLLKFNADIPKYEITTGLVFAGETVKGQAVRLVYCGVPEDGFVRGEYLLFNPDSPMAADIDTLLYPGDDGAFFSDNGQYRLYADSDTAVTDSLGRKTELHEGQYILGWFREAVFKESAVLGRVVVLSVLDDTQPYRQIKITDSGDVLLDDGPIAKLDAFQTDFCRQYHMAPIRPIAEALGYTVEWTPDRTIRVLNGDYAFHFNINDDYYQINDKFVYYSGRRFIITRGQTFADYSVINVLINKSGPLSS